MKGANVLQEQGSYMDKLNKEYIELLSEDANPSDKFWKLDERIKRIGKKLVLEQK